MQPVPPVEPLICPDIDATYSLLDKNMPSEHMLLCGHSIGNYFIMGQDPIELFSIFDATADVAEATKLSRQAHLMRMTTLRGQGAHARTFQMVKARMLDPKGAAEVLLSNVYADQPPLT